MSDTVLGVDVENHQRLRVGRSLIAGLIYIVCMTIMHLSVWLGLTEPHAAALATLYILAGPVVFYALLRSGKNKHFADPALTMAQMLFGISALILGYAINPATRATVLLIVALVMMFGMFALSSRQARNLTCVSLLAFGLEMATLSYRNPRVYPPHIEVMNFIGLTIVLPMIAALASELDRLRTRRREQRAALEKALEHLESLVSHDELTGMWNRRRMLEFLVQELAQRPAKRSPLCVCLLDLDYFKRINDNYGHTAGDEALRRFAHQVQANLRSIDVLARWGGEEFLLLLPGTNAAHAGQAIDRLRQGLAVPSAWQDRPEVCVTMSVGIAEWHEGDSSDSLIERADRGAYRAKAEGRDRWCLEPPVRSAAS